MPASSSFTGSGWGSFRMMDDVMQLKFNAGQPLNLKISLLMGQAFRWKEASDGWFCGVVQGQHIQVRKIRDGLLEFRGQPGPDDAIAGILKTYLRLDEDIAVIYDCLSARDPKIAELIAKYPGLRILRQEPWECLVSYICSANNKVEQIGKLVERISERFGEPISLDGETRYSFPTPERLADKLSQLKELGLGLNRAPNIHRAAQRIVRGDLDLGVLKSVSYSDAKYRLMEYDRVGKKPANGIGDKIADCILLFSLDKPQAFPIDTHIRSALANYFPVGENLPDAKLRDWALNRFGRYAGYAGQFLFYEERPRGNK